MNIQQASLLMILGAILWGTNPALIQLINWAPIEIAWIRGFFCAGVLLFYLSKARVFSSKSFGLQLISALFLAANSALFVGASQYTSSANAVLLLFVFPWITMALDFFILQRKPQNSDLIRLCLGFSGVVIIVWGGLNDSGVLGNILGICAGFSIAMHIFLSQRLEVRHGGNHEVMTSVMIAWTLTMIGLIPAVMIHDAPPLRALNTEQLFYLIIFGLFSAIPWLLWGKAIAYVPGHVLAALLGVEVFVAALCGWLLLGDIPSTETWIGGTLTLLAASWQIMANNKR